MSGQRLTIDWLEEPGPVSPAMVKLLDAQADARRKIIATCAVSPEMLKTPLHLPTGEMLRVRLRMA